MLTNAQTTERATPRSTAECRCANLLQSLVYTERDWQELLPGLKSL